MSLSDKYYRPKFIMCEENAFSHKKIDLWTFKSEKSGKRYIVEVELFDFDFVGIKFYWKGVEKSKNRYSLLTNDFEPRVILRTCVEIMLEYYRKNNHVSFGFVAAPDLDKDVRGKNISSIGNRRFRFYQKFIINLFGPETFLQFSDETHSIYLVVNNEQYRSGAITKQSIEQGLNSIFEGNFSIDGTNSLSTAN